MSVTRWTGREVRALRIDALRVTQREFAERLGFSEAVVRKWEGRGETIILQRQFAAAMDTVLQRLDKHQLARFDAALGGCKTIDRNSDDMTSAVEGHIPKLRRVLDSHDMPDDGPIRPTNLLREAVGSAVTNRLNSNYLRLACELPLLLTELHRARIEYSGIAVNSLLVQAYRAADAIADKHGYTDLSARIIGMMRDTADSTGDDLLAAMTAYVRTELFFGNQQFSTGRKLLEAAADNVDPTSSVRAAATFGALHMRAAVLAGREFLPDVARAHLVEAERAADSVPESSYLGTAFGQSSVQIHRMSLSIELGDIGGALAVARTWSPAEDVPAERRSHFYIDLARASMQVGRRDRALIAIQQAHSIAPQHTASHPQVKDMLTRLST